MTITMVTQVFNDAHAGARRIGVTTEEGRSTVLLVGEDNPHSSDPWPMLANAAGHRLQSKILGLELLTYYGTWRTNLCTPSWSKIAAVRRVVALLYANDPPWRTVVCLGRRVSDAFAHVVDVELPTWAWYPLWVQLPLEPERVIKIVSLPHPSGRTRTWNDPAAVARARALLTEVAPDVRWGELGSRIPAGDE